MKLKIKHLAPYLPYGIRVRVDYYTRHEGRIFNFSPTILLDFSRDEYIVKPILRPLSDLTKEIEVKGEIFVPVDYLKSNYPCFGFNYNEEDGFILNTDVVNYKYLPFMILYKLSEWHFDVFGLIPQGLAIDINTLTE